MKKYFNLMGRHFFAVALSFFFLNCGGATSSSGTDSGSVNPQLTTIDELPQATGPVDAEASSNISALSSKATVTPSAVGMNMRDVDESFFTTESSTAACEMYNMTKNAIQNAAQGDKILCYVKQIFTAAIAAGVTDRNGNPIDIYDGLPHVFALDFTGAQVGNENISASESEGEHGGPDHVKFTINKPADVIIGFEMHACNSGTQNEYLSQTINGDSFRMTSKNFNSDGGNEFASDTEVTGTLNESGHFVGSKNIAMNFTGTMSDETSQFGVYNFVQGTDSATMTGYMNGTFNDAEHDVSGSFTNQLVGSMGMLDPNVDGAEYDIGLLALADGAVHVAWSGSAGEQTHTDERTEGWNGDTGAIDADIAAAYITEVENSTLPVEDAPTIAFGDGETYDCGDIVDATIVIADIDVDVTECSNLELSHEWINCWQIVQEGQGGGNEEQQMSTSCTSNSECVDMFTGMGSPQEVLDIAVCSAGTCGIDCGATMSPESCVTQAENDNGWTCIDNVCTL